MRSFVSIFLCFLFLTLNSFALEKKQEKDSIQHYTKQVESWLKKTNRVHRKEIEGKNDSLKLYIAQTIKYLEKIPSNDSLALIVYDDLAWLHKYDDSKLSRSYSDSLEQIAKRTNDDYYLIGAYSYKAQFNSRKGNYNASIKYYKKVVELAKPRKGEMASLNLAGYYYNISGLYKKIEKDSMSKRMAEVAFKTFDTTTVFGKKYIHQSYVFRLRSMDYLPSKKAEAFMKRAIPVFTKAKRKNLVVHTYNGVGTIFLKEKKFKKAYTYIQKAHQENAVKNQKNSIDLSLANYYIKTGNYIKAKEHFEKFSDFFVKSEGSYKKVSSYYTILNNVNELGSLIYRELKDFEKADYFTQKYLEYKVKILAQKEDAVIEEFEVKFETEQKEKLLQLKSFEIEQEQKKFYFLLSSVLIISLIIVIIFLVYDKRKKTKLLILEQDLKSKNLRTQFFENIVHEIRTPITIIRGYLNLINKNTSRPEEILKYSDRALSSCSDIISGSNDFLTLVKSEQKSVELFLEKKHFSNFLKETLLTFEGEISFRNIVVEYHTNTKEDLQLELDYKKLEKIVQNLITNAIKYSPDNSVITVSTTVNSNEIELCVQDEGYGIKEDEKELIFERFFQGTYSKISSGIGIGLSLVKKLANSLGGEISVESKIDKGSVFCLVIPHNKKTIDSYLLKKLDCILITDKNEELEEVEQNLPKILIVEDNFEMTRYLKDLLKPMFVVDICLSATKALEIVKTKPYQLIISDLRMPKIDGFSFKEKINTTQHKDVPFIMLTANTLLENRETGLTLGINDYMIKPFDSCELITRIRILLSNKKAQLKAIKDSVEDNQSKMIQHEYNEILKSVRNAILKNIAEEDFNVVKLAAEVNYGQRQLSRILKSTTGMTPVKLILEIRLLKAYDLILNDGYNRINEIMNEVGISSYAYFTKSFVNRFGVKPSELIHKNSISTPSYVTIGSI